MMSLQRLLRKIPIIGTSLAVIRDRLLTWEHRSSSYWETRYSKGGTSGAGSYGALARYKADYINTFMAKHDVSTVIELGCGDGNQVGLCAYRKYLGFDVSETAVAKCRAMYVQDPSKTFLLMSEWSGQTADLALSLDVIYHLTEDDAFHDYMGKLFASAGRFAVIYSSNFDAPQRHHIRHRTFDGWVRAHAPEFRLLQHEVNRYPYSDDDPDNTSFADFFVYYKPLNPTPIG